MKKGLMLLVVLGCLLAFSATAFSASTSTQNVVFNIGSVTEVSVNGTPTLDILAWGAGQQPVDDVDASTTISYSCNSSAPKKITGALDSSMPTGVQLFINISASGSQGQQELTSSPKSLITGIAKTSVANATITYTLHATTSAEAVTEASKTITFTMTAQ